jgi:hypothetical protein
MGCASSLVFSPPRPRNFSICFDPNWIFAASPVIGPHPFNVFIPIGCGIIFVTLLAFVEMAVSHSRMRVKITQRLDGVALKTIFHDGLLKTHHTRFD